MEGRCWWALLCAKRGWDGRISDEGEYKVRRTLRGIAWVLIDGREMGRGDIPQRMISL